MCIKVGMGLFTRKNRFIAHDYFVVVFKYEFDIIGFSIEVGEES